MKTKIKATENMYNSGLCFTKGKTYEVNGTVETEAGLMDKTAINDQGEAHRIGSWWRRFEIIY